VACGSTAFTLMVSKMTAAQHYLHTQGSAQPIAVSKEGVGGIAICGVDPDEWGTPHRRGGEIPKGVVVRPLALPTADAEPARFLRSTIVVGVQQRGEEEADAPSTAGRRDPRILHQRV
jgi:hypothetical protein